VRLARWGSDRLLAGMAIETGTRLLLEVASLGGGWPVAGSPRFPRFDPCRFSPVDWEPGAASDSTDVFRVGPEAGPPGWQRQPQLLFPLIGFKLLPAG